MKHGSGDWFLIAVLLVLGALVIVVRVFHH
jgi:hypothetical protein